MSDIRLLAFLRGPAEPRVPEVPLPPLVLPSEANAAEPPPSTEEPLVFRGYRESPRLVQKEHRRDETEGT